jgi:molybdopterin molybdotransferase
MDELISVAVAEALIRSRLGSFGTENVSLDRAAGRIVRQVVGAERDQPPFDRVTMDGIALAFGEPFLRSYAVAGLALAGAPAQRLVAAEGCIEVTTGAVMPHGCDTVIPVERTRTDGNRVLIEDGYEPVRGQFVHARGSDCVAGTGLISPGVRLRAPEMAVLAANGVASVEVARIPSIVMVSTGDELVDVDAPVADWQIRRSNDRALAAALHGRGFDDIDFAQVGDDLETTMALLAEQLDRRQVLILSGGVSMGQRDYVPEALRELGVEKVFHKVAQRPGKPMWFGIGPQGQAVFALPGNPVSALVCCVRYVLPALLEAMGAAVDETNGVTLVAPAETNAALTCFVPASLENGASGRVLARPVPSNTSGDFFSLTRTHGFIQLPPGQDTFAAGFVAPFYHW